MLKEITSKKRSKKNLSVKKLDSRKIYCNYEQSSSVQPSTSNIKHQTDGDGDEWQNAEHA